MTITQTDIHVGDVGTVFLVTIMDTGSPVDLSSASATDNSILLRKPDGTILTQIPSFYTDGKDGKIQFTVSGSTLLDQAGAWRITAIAKTSTGRWTSSAIDFTVKSVFQLDM